MRTAAIVTTEAARGEADLVMARIVTEAETIRWLTLGDSSATMLTP